MNWLNIRLVNLRAPEFIGSDPLARATWLCVAAYCAEQENGGRIVAARQWKDRQWQQTCGVTIAEVDAATRLLAWEDDDLLVWNYPAEKEAEIRVKREAGKVGGGRSGKARIEHSLADNPSTASSTASSIPSISASTEGEGEGEGNSKKKKNGARAPDGFEELPAELNTAEFREVWISFLTYRKKKRLAALLPESVKLQWRKMRSWGVGAAIAQIEETISMGWQGVFAPKAGTIFKPPAAVMSEADTADLLERQRQNRAAKDAQIKAAFEELRNEES